MLATQEVDIRVGVFSVRVVHKGGLAVEVAVGAFEVVVVLPFLESKPSRVAELDFATTRTMDITASATAKSRFAPNRSAHDATPQAIAGANLAGRGVHSGLGGRAQGALAGQPMRSRP